MTDKIADKIAALLRKAESTDSPHEAEALTAAAEKLMLKHGIERTMLNLDSERAKAEEIIQIKLEPTGAAHIKRAKVDMIHSITLALELRSFFIDVKSMPVYIVGFESDAQDAVTLINSLLLQMDVAMAHWWKSLDPEDRRVGYDRMLMYRDFIVGFGWGAASRIRNERKVAVAEVIEETGNTGTELALLDRKKAVDAHLSSAGLKTSRSGNGRRSVDATAAGTVAGRNANTGGNALGQGRGIAQ